VQTLAGILILIAGVIFPMAMVAWLSIRLGRKPALGPPQVGLVLALNAALPAALVTSGLALLMPHLWATDIFRYAVVAAWAAVVTVLTGLIVMRLAARTAAKVQGEQGSNGR
jgi:hypothetical protein